MELIFLSFIAFVSTFTFIQLLNPFASKLKLVDSSDKGRKHHRGAIPLIGGLGIFFSFTLTSLISNIEPYSLIGIFSALSIIIIIGIIDDRKHLSVKARFFFQILAVFIMCKISNVVIYELGDLFGGGNIHLNNWSIIFTIFATIGVMNAINLIDGIDGLAASLSLVCLTAITMAQILNGDAPQMTIILSASIAAFLWFNLVSKKKVFLGDAGSTFLGLAITWFLIESSQGESKMIEPITAVWILSLPIFDTVAIMIRRVKKGQSPFKPDRDHLHHIFMHAGFSDKATLVILLLLASLLAGTGLLLNHLNIATPIQTLAVCSLFFVYYQSINHSWRLTVFLRSTTPKKS